MLISKCNTYENENVVEKKTEYMMSQRHSNLFYKFLVCFVHLSWPCQPMQQTIRLMRFIYCDIFYCLSGSNYEELIILHNDLPFQSRHVFLTHWKNLTRWMTATAVDKTQWGIIKLMHHIENDGTLSFAVFIVY